MRIKRLLVVVVTVSLMGGLTACQNKSEKKESGTTYELSRETKEKVLKEGQELTNATLAVFQKHLKSAIKEGGLDHALDYCHKKAMFLTDSISNAKGVVVRRLAKKNRNPFNILDKEGEQVYAEYEKEIAAGKPLKPQVRVNRLGNAVYYAPIKISKEVCLKCHGMPGKDIPPERVKKIQKYYRHDKATGFKMGDLRAVWAVIFPQYSVEAK